MTRQLDTPIRRDPNVEDITPIPADGGDERRAAERHSANQPVAVRFGDTDIICDLVELSEAGAKFSATNCDVPARGEAIAIRLLDGTVLNGKVTWSRQPRFGVAFSEPLAGIDDRLDQEDLGRAYFARAVALQKAARRRT